MLDSRVVQAPGLRDNAEALALADLVMLMQGFAVQDNRLHEAKYFTPTCTRFVTTLLDLYDTID
jgi:hypothetical protein